MSYRYYSTQRPVAPGTFPKPQGNKVIEVKNFDTPRYFDSIGDDAWGYIDYEHILDNHEAEQYELTIPYDFTFEFSFSKDEPYTQTFEASCYSDAWYQAIEHMKIYKLCEPDKDDNFLMQIEWLATEQRKF